MSSGMVLFRLQATDQRLNGRTQREAGAYIGLTIIHGVMRYPGWLSRANYKRSSSDPIRVRSWWHELRSVTYDGNQLLIDADPQLINGENVRASDSGLIHAMD